MLLTRVLVRFYKSFNYDYLRKFHPRAEFDPWDNYNGMDYPYVVIPIDPEVTTVVGANESGKSHLLSAIRKGIEGTGIAPEDFCRYSPFFSVESGNMGWPEFGFEFADLSASEAAAFSQACELGAYRPNYFVLFRVGPDSLVIYYPPKNGGKAEAKSLSHTAAKSLIEVLPQVFHIHSKTALPESVPIKFLAAENPKEAFNGKLPDRVALYDLAETFGTSAPWFATEQAVTQNAKAIVEAFSKFASRPISVAVERERRAEWLLAHQLIRKVARVDPQMLESLSNAIRDGKQGYANGLIQKINSMLENALNFPKWWVQDRDFRLLVSPRETDLVFTIRDRTGTDYSFAERSNGLRFFLSYYVQYLAFEPEETRHPVLLMDEPDAYLSAQAQQDLLKILAAFAAPGEGTGRRPVQVIYVTHSPFLVDRNHAERIRVLEKGVGDEGTRVVRDASKNHYEPLRSAFGSYVAETTFIGHCNLMVEGPADQVLLAGAAIHLRGRGTPETECLDLNSITIVPAGSASHIPYLVYLARGRDVDQPAVIVLLDSDSAGDTARKGLNLKQAQINIPSV